MQTPPPGLPGASLEGLKQAIQIWAISTGGPLDQKRLERVLDAAEWERAARFRRAESRNSFAVTRAALRGLLGRYLTCDPAAIEFHYGPYGKPWVASPSRVHFSVSHSGELSVLAFAVGCELGVDIEHLRPFPDWREIAERHFRPEETAEIHSLVPSDREGAFFRCWTRKEALVKATGEGFSKPIDRFHVSVRPGEAPVVRILDAEIRGDWNLHNVEVKQGIAGALAYCGERRPMEVFGVFSAADVEAFVENA